ncbi:MAG TPA: hypothetical protein VIQ51_09035 [Chryseosolibacter sp.]
MDAIRKKRIKRTGRQVIVDLPENFTAEEVDLILWPSIEENENVKKNQTDLLEWRKDIEQFYSKYNVDLSGFEFNRDELYDRP